jgi:hypothetical protein
MAKPSYADLSEHDLTEFTSIDISLVETDVTFVPSDHYGFDARIRDYTGGASGIEWSNDNGVLKIKYKSRFSFGFGNLIGFGMFSSEASYLKVYYPADNYPLDRTERYESISIETVSGDITCPFSSETGKFKTVSGDAEVNGTYDELTINTVSGELSFGGSAKTLKAGAVSGDVEIEGKTENLTTSTVSGEIEIHGEFADVKASTTSGDITLSTQKSYTDYDITVNTLSGQIEIDRAKFGKQLNRPATGDSAGKLKISTTSGNVEMKNS